MEEQKIDIPDYIQDICRDFAKVAQKHKLLQFGGKFSQLGSWGGDISFSWEKGRHGEDSDQLQITSNFFVHTKVSGKTT